MIQFRRMRQDAATDSEVVTENERDSVRNWCFQTLQSQIVKAKHCTHLVGLIVGHQFIDGCGLGDLQQDRLGLLPPLRCSRAHVTEVAGPRALALAGAVHTDAGSHALCTRVQQTGNVCGVGQRPRLLVALL